MSDTSRRKEIMARTIGNILRTTRQRRGLSEAKAATAAGIRQPVLSRYERGLHLAPPHVIYALARVLEVSPHDLMPAHIPEMDALLDQQKEGKPTP